MDKTYKLKKRIKYFSIFLILIGIEVFIALFIHDRIIRPYIGDILVEVVIYMLIKAVVPDRIKHLPISIFVFSAGVEILQYFNIAEALGLGNIRFFKILIGSVFDIKDIVCYGIGCLILQIGEWAVKKIEERNTRL